MIDAAEEESSSPETSQGSVRRPTKYPTAPLEPSSKERDVGSAGETYGAFEGSRPNPRSHGPLSIGEMGVDAAYRYLLKRIVYATFKGVISPSLEDFSGYATFGFPLQLVQSLSGVIATPETTAEIVREFSGLSEILRERYMRTRLTHPSNWAIEQGTSLAVYAIIRLVKPEKVLETGVANGHSSFFILKGLELNRRGVLYSVDINPAVGPLLSDQERRDWNLSVLPKSRRKDALKRFARRISPIDVFIHDSNHLYYWQMFEFRLAFELLRRGGYLLVDDCDCSFAFLDFAQKHGLSPQFLLDRRKLFGVVRV